MRGIYKIKNKVNGKYYVGSSIDVEKRWYEHRWLLERGDHNPYLQNAWDKHGEKNFIFEFVKEVENEETLRPIEQEFLDEGFAKDILYNISIRAGGGNLGEEVNRKISEACKGRKHTEEAKAKMSAARKGRVISEEQRIKISRALMGREFSEEHKANISAGHKGIVFSEEHRAKLAKSKLGEKNPMYGSDRSGENNPMYGKVGYWAGKRNLEHSKRMVGKGNPFYGKHHSKETKVELSKASARPYPAFYNVKTGTFIPAGKNLLGLCERHGLSLSVMWYVKGGIARQARDGWRLATEEEISNHGCC